MAQKKILLVTDSPDLALAYEIMLSGKGYDVFGINSVKEAKTQLKKTQFNLVLIDMEEERSDSRIASFSKETKPDIPVVVIKLTDHITTADDEKSEEEADVYMEKPAELAELTETINNLLLTEA